MTANKRFYVGMAICFLMIGIGLVVLSLAIHKSADQHPPIIHNAVDTQTAPYTAHMPSLGATYRINDIDAVRNVVVSAVDSGTLEYSYTVVVRITDTGWHNMKPERIGESDAND